MVAPNLSSVVPRDLTTCACHILHGMVPWVRAKSMGFGIDCLASSHGFLMSGFVALGELLDFLVSLLSHL